RLERLMFFLVALELTAEDAEDGEGLTTIPSASSASSAVSGMGSVGSTGASSRTQSRGGLSVRTRNKVAWRRRPSGVHSRKRTSAQYTGSTQVVVFASGTSA